MAIKRHTVVLATTCLFVASFAVSGRAARAGKEKISRFADGTNSILAEPQDADLKTVSVAAFKNGLAFVIRQGDVKLESGMGKIAPIPSATLGTLWIAPNDPGTSLDELVSYRYKVAGQRSLASIGEILTANPGKTVTAIYNQKEYAGEILGLRDELPPAEPQPGPFPGVSTPVTSSAPPAPHFAAQVLLLKQENRIVALPFSSISQVFLPTDVVLKEKQEAERKALRFKVKGSDGHANLTMGYLEHGLGWTPSYMISLKDDKTAQITMQAVVVDDAEDLRDTELYFVVGVPNFAYSGTPSPMALQQSLLDFLQTAQKDERNERSPYGNAIGGQLLVNAEYDQVRAPAPSFATLVQELSGAPEEDLFLYSRGGVTLARGERATYNVFSASVGFEHVYEWEVQDPPRVDGYGVVQSYPGNPTDHSANNIWHSIKLKNATKFPWTSAPATVISGTKPVSQDTLPYTPKAASSNLKLTIATDIRASHEEQEVGRQSNIERRRGYNYDLVTVEGKLKVKSYKSKDVRLNISKTLRGEVDTQSHGGTASKLAEGIQTDNPLSQLTWEVTLTPGEEKTITYRYRIWVRV